jgi:hypothetical protein
MIKEKENNIDRIHNLISPQGLLTQEFLAQLKTATEEQNKQDPSNVETHERERQALLKLFISNRMSFIQEGTKQAESNIKAAADHKLTRDSKALEQANKKVCIINTSKKTGTDKLEGKSPSTLLLQTQNAKDPSLCKGNSSSQEYQREEPSNKGNFKKTRRMSIKRKREIVHNNSLIHEFTHNLTELGVAECHVHNLTDYQFKDKQLEGLALGIKFIPSPLPNDKIIDEAMAWYTRTVRLKNIYKDKSDTSIPKYWIPSSYNPDSSKSTAELENILKELNSKLRNSPTQKYTPNMHPSTMNNLNDILTQEDIIVITADKNLGYAIVSKEWYIKEILAHLNKPDSYENVTSTFLKNDNGKTSISKIYKEMIELIEQYKIYLDSNEFKFITQEKPWQLMKFYITAKVHKIPIKGRPIVPSMCWVTYNLSSWIADHLNPLLVNHQIVLKDSTQLISKLEDKEFQRNMKGKDLFIISADVDALYPNMDVNTILDLISCLLTNINWETKGKREFIIQAIHFVLTNGFMEFNGLIVRQFNGAAMGSPMIPPLANLFMYMLERDTVSTWYTKGLITYKRFIDDIFMIFEGNKTNLDILMSELNNLHPKIKLTWEVSTKKCNFLDICIRLNKKDKQPFSISIYQKPLNRYMYLPWKSYHTMHMKKGFIKGECIRYARLSTKKSDFDEIKRIFIYRLQKRGYPLQFILNSLKDITWEERIKYLSPKVNNKDVPHIFKVEYNPRLDPKYLRQALLATSLAYNKGKNIPAGLLRHIKVCYKLPPKLHISILKSRKKKGF